MSLAKLSLPTFGLFLLTSLIFPSSARAAVSYIGASNLIATNGAAPGAITPHASTQNGDLLIFYHYSRATGGNETVSLSSFNFAFNSVTANNGLVAVGWRIKQAGDTTFTATITNHTSGNTGETVVEWIETYRGTHTTSPIPNFTSSLSTWVSSLNLGSIAAPTSATVNDGDMVVVFGGRFENITAQTTLTGNSLTWANRTLNNTTSGSDAAAVTQNGLNSSGSDQTVTAKTITTTGTAQAGAGRMFIIEQAPPTTTLADGTNPSNSTLGPGDGITDIDSFTLTTSTGTDSVTGLSVQLAPLTSASLSEIRVTSDNGSTTYFSAVTNPTGNIITFSGGTPIPVTTTTTQFKVRITPETHVDMPPPNGSTYLVTAVVQSLTMTNTLVGSDDNSATISIDNTSPGSVTSSTATGGIEQVSLSWTNPNDSDFSQVVVVRRESSAVTDSPVEGASYSVGNPLDSSTIACVTASASCTDTNVVGGATYHYKLFTKDNRGNYEIGTTPSGSPVTPTALVISITITTDGTISYGNVNLGESKSTLDLSDTQTVSNDSNVAIDLNIKSSAALGGTAWSLGTTPGNNVCVHEFSTNSGSNWTKFLTADSYQSLSSNLAISGTQNIDYRLTVPTTTSDYLQKTLTTTIQAVQH